MKCVFRHKDVCCCVAGNMWAQGWESIFETVAPYKGNGNLDVTDTMKQQVYI